MANCNIKTHGNSIVASWKGLKADSNGVSFDCTFLKPLTVSCEGNFGEGGFIVMEGSIGGKFQNIETAHGGIVSAMSENMESLSGRYLSVRPIVVGGSEETSIDVYLFCDTIPKRRAGK